MKSNTSSRVAKIAHAMLIYVPLAAVADEAADEDNQRGSLATVVVSATRESELLSETPASLDVIDTDAVRSVGPTHPQQILSQVPGVAVAVTNGEGHTTAIRQPFTTSPVYLFLEDGVPIRATGFFNHNALYEVDIPMAGGIEVTRGPGSALYGSDAIGGIINMLTRRPAATSSVGGSLEAGSFGWRRLLVEGDTGSGRWGAMRADVNVTGTDGWRDATAYDRLSADMRWDVEVGETRVKTVIAFGRIDQDTGANSPLIFDDYRNSPKRNNFAIAYRKVDSLRLSVDVEKVFGDGLLSLTPFVRDNRMELLASFSLSSDPTVYTSANRSVGLLAKWRQDFPNFLRARLIGGVDFDYSPGWREEDRLNVTVSGVGASRSYTAYTVGARIYDYDVSYQQVSPYLHGELSLTSKLRTTVGLRYDSLKYRLDNNFPVGSVQAGAGLFYGQAADETKSFDHLTPKFGLTYAINDSLNAYASYNKGFRAPSESQLFRPSVSATASDASNRARLALNLRPLNAMQVEIGLRGSFSRWSFDTVAFDLQKRNDLVTQRDSATNVTTSVNAGKTSHRGIEVGAGVRIVPTLRFDTAISYARHQYDTWVTSTATLSGKEIEAAPRVLTNSRLSWSPSQTVDAQMEWIRISDYWLEASNSPVFGKYSGYDILNVRTKWKLSEPLAVFARIYNVADKVYADSAQVSSNTPVYSPGLPRTYYVGIDGRW